MFKEVMFPPNAVVIRFSTDTPFYPLSLSFGLFFDPTIRLFFTSIDAYIGYHMLVRDEDRYEVIRVSNGYLANRNLQAILERGDYVDGQPIVSPTWETDCDDVLMDGLRMKYSQSTCLAELLERTGDRPIFDASRYDDTYFCYGDGSGKNVHGKSLEKLRAERRLASTRRRA